MNLLDRHRFAPYLIATRGSDGQLALTLRDDINFIVLNKKPGRDWSIVRKLAAFFQEHQIDIVHSHNWETFLYAFLAARLAQVPVFIQGEHGRDTREIEDGWLKLRVKSLLAWQSDRLITVSQDIADLMIEKWQVNSDKIVVIPNGVDLTRFKESKNRTALRQWLGFPGKAIVIGTVIGTLRPIKDVPTLLQAFATVSRQHSVCRLVIMAGTNGPANGSVRDDHHQQIMNIISSLGLERAVHFVPPKQDVETYMQSFDIYANSSLYEGMSNTLLEAMACGVPVVATRVGGTPFIVHDGYNGLLVSPGAPDELANALCALAANPWLRERIAENGFRYAREKHDLRSFVTAHERIYEETYYQKTKRRVLPERSPESKELVH